MPKEPNVEKILNEMGIAYPECGFYIGKGWLPIVLDTLALMINAGWNKDLHQVKSKFCTLRIYIGQGNDEIDKFIRYAEDLCNVSCENCGQPHGLQVPRSGVAYCKECYEKEGYVK